MHTETAANSIVTTARTIDMISYVKNEDGNIRVFTDDYHFISQDTRHLTKAGAQYYSRMIDLEKIFKIKI